MLSKPVESPKFLLQVVEDDLRSLMFCDFTPNNEAGTYNEVQNVDDIREVIEHQLSEYNQMSKAPMNLVIFRSGGKLYSFDCVLMCNGLYRCKV